MKLDELLYTIEKVAADNNLDKPYIVGGIPRDRVLGLFNDVTEIRDVDITTGSNHSTVLARLVGSKLSHSIYREYDDEHSSVDFMGVHMDFSSNFVIPGIMNELNKMGIKDMTPMKMELYSRDFTINTLLESLDFKNLYDLTEKGVADIKAKIIRCPINPNITIGVDPRRILRAIKFSIKYDFDINDDLKNAMKEYKENIADLPVKFVQEKIAEIVRLDADKGIEVLILQDIAFGSFD